MRQLEVNGLKNSLKKNGLVCFLARNSVIQQIPEKKNQIVENAGVAFVKGTNERNELKKKQ